MKKCLSVAAAVLMLAATPAVSQNAPATRNLLEKTLRQMPEGTFMTGGRLVPYPDYNDREGWKEFAGNDAGAIVREGEARLGYVWKSIPATSYLEFERNGGRTEESRGNSNLNAFNSLVLAELVEGKGRFMPQIINGVWMMTEKVCWGWGAGQRRQKSGRTLPDRRDYMIELGAQRWACCIALAWHFFHEEWDKVDPAISREVYESMKDHIFDPFMDDAKLAENYWVNLDFKGRVINNWTPWCNSHVLMCYLLMEGDYDAMMAGVDRCVRSTDTFLDFVKDDGACDEGPGYWGRAAGSLMDFLTVMKDASAGRYDVFAEPKIKDKGDYMSRVELGGGWVANWGDAAPRQVGDCFLLYRYGRLCASEELRNYAVFLRTNPETGAPKPSERTTDDLFRSLETLRYEKEFLADCKDALAAAGGDPAKMRSALRKDVPECFWYPQTGHVFLRNGAGLALATKGGTNNESHNHNDIGNCILIAGGAPVLIDLGVGTYTKKTFSKDRYSIWTMQSCWHNLPTINGADQHNGREYVAREEHFDGAKRIFGLDIAGAYDGEARAQRWYRTYSLKGNCLTITDEYQLTERVAPDIEHFIVKGDARIARPGLITIRCESADGTVKTAQLSYPKTLEASVERVSLKGDSDGIEYEKGRETRSGLSRHWGESVGRISLKSSPDSPVSGSYTFKIKVK